MSERLNTRGLAEHLANQTGMDRKRAEEFIDALSLYFMQGLERNKIVKISGLGVFKILLVRERESIHIQTGERFAIPAHHKITFQPDKDFKEQINRPFSLFEAIEATESEILALNKQAEADYIEIDESETISRMDHDELEIFEPFSPVENASNNDETIEQSIFSGNTSYIENDLEIDLDDEVLAYDNEETLFEEQFEPQSLNIDTESYEDPFDPRPAESYEETYEDTFETQPLNDDAEMYEKQFEPLPPRKAPAYVDESADDEPLSNDVVKKKKSGLLWLFLAVISLSCILGSGIGLYWFLKTNTDKSVKLKQSQDDIQSSSTFDTGSALTFVDISTSGGDQQDIIESPSVSNDQIISNTESNPSSINSTSNQEEKIDRNWLVPLPDNTKPEMRRADRPNQEIEARNRALTNNSRTETTTANNRTTATVTPPPVTPSPSTNSASVSNAKNLPTRIKMQAGSTLMQLALDYYGDKVFWVYIYEHNKNNIKNFNNIPIGTELLLPEAKSYGIDSKNAASKDKALQIQRQLIRR